MEQQHLCILLHSNYSAICRQLLSALQECPVNIYSLTGLSLLCVDNEKIRKKITQCRKIEITSVPTLLIISGTTLEKYEGQDVFDWIDTIVNKYLPPQENYPPPQENYPPPPPPPPPQEEYEYEYDEEEQLPPPRKQPPPPRKQPPPPRKQPPPPRKQQPILEDLDAEDTTTIEDLDSDGETEDIITPPAGVRNGPGGYDLSNNFGKKEERPAQKSNETSDSKSSLMASAMAMQKERESDTDKSAGKQKLM